MGQNAYKNGDSEVLQAIDCNSDLATGRLKRAFADNEKMPDIAATPIMRVESSLWLSVPV